MGLGSWLAARKAAKDAASRAKKRERDGCKVYRFGGGWGDALQWDDERAGKVYGFKRRIPQVGDLVISPMWSGRDLVFEFISVSPCGSPVDMFFGCVEGVAYTDTDKGKAALATSVSDSGGMHPGAHRYWDPPKRF